MMRWGEKEDRQPPTSAEADFGEPREYLSYAILAGGHVVGEFVEEIKVELVCQGGRGTGDLSATIESFLERQTEEQEQGLRHHGRQFGM